jgi:hypothetical protein
LIWIKESETSRVRVAHPPIRLPFTRNVSRHIRPASVESAEIHVDSPGGGVECPLPIPSLVSLSRLGYVGPRIALDRAEATRAVRRNAQSCQTRHFVNDTVRVAPSFLEQVPLRQQHRAHPLLTLGYQEVFDVLGGTRNLGVAVNLFYSENAVGGFRTDRDYQNTLNETAFVWGYRTWDNYNNRKQKSLNVKADYRYSFNSKFTFSFTVNDNIEKFRRVYQTRAFTGNANTVPNATPSGVIPGFTNRITEVRPVASSIMDIMISGPNKRGRPTTTFRKSGRLAWMRFTRFRSEFPSRSRPGSSGGSRRRT